MSFRPDKQQQQQKQKQQQQQLTCPFWEKKQAKISVQHNLSLENLVSLLILSYIFIGVSSDLKFC